MAPTKNPDRLERRPGLYPLAMYECASVGDVLLIMEVGLHLLRARRH